jgi:hypothetical protein
VTIASSCAARIIEEERMTRKVQIALGIWIGSALAGAAQPGSATLTGTLVDRVRYTKEKNVANCAQDIVAAKKGGPVAIVTDKGEMYTVVGDFTDNDNAKLGPYMCKMVSITGEVAGDTKNVRRTIMATSLKAASK